MTAVAWMALFVFATSAFAEDARLADIVVTNTRDDLLVYLRVEGCFTPEMNEAIQSGIPTTFNFMITLDKVRNWWFNEELADLDVSRTIRYDAMKMEYTVIRSEDPDNPMMTHSFAEAKKAMAQISGLPVVSLSALEKGRRYSVKAKAELDRVTLPLYLHYVFFFVSFWDFETDWYKIDFSY